jgi:hypothetical protein
MGLPQRPMPLPLEPTIELNMNLLIIFNFITNLKAKPIYIVYENKDIL